jgi:hypothetical protein
MVVLSLKTWKCLQMKVLCSMMTSHHQMHHQQQRKMFRFLTVCYLLKDRKCAHCSMSEYMIFISEKVLIVQCKQLITIQKMKSISTNIII